MNALLIGLLCLTSLAPRSLAEDTPAKPVQLNFGVYQSDKATVMYKKFTPVLERLQEDMEPRLKRPVDIRLTIFNTYDDAIDALVYGNVDFVRFGPAPYITAKAAQPGIELLAMEQENGEKRFKGVVIVPSSSPVHSLAELKGKRFAFGDRNSTIGRYLIQSELLKAGLHANDLASYKYLGRHDTVARAVEMGDFDAGSVMMSAFEQANEKGTLRVIASFDNVTKPWVARKGLERDVIEALQKSLFALSDPAVLKELKVSGFAPTSDAEYQFVREGMKQADEFEKKRSDS